MISVDSKAVGDYLEVHTRHAESLLKGSWKSGRLGLLKFAGMMRNLYEASKSGDPYAEWYLLKIDKAIYLACKQIRNVERACQAILDSVRGIEIELYRKDLPIKFPLKFSNPFSYMAARLIVDIDYLVRLRLTLQRFGLSIPVELGLLTSNRIVQDIFSLSAKWQATNVTRQDIIDNNSVAQNARIQYGDVPVAVLNKEVEFSFFSDGKKEKSYESTSI